MRARTRMLEPTDRELLDAVDPEYVRDTIPEALTLKNNRPPWSGEVREEALREFKSPIELFAGTTTILDDVVTLRRPWPVVQGGLDFGDQRGNGAITWTIQYKILTGNGSFVQAPGFVLPSPPLVPLAAPSILAGARVTLRVLALVAGGPFTVNNLSAAIWGSNATMLQGRGR